MALSMQVTVLCRCEYLDSWHGRQGGWGWKLGLCSGNGEAWVRGEGEKRMMEGGALVWCIQRALRLIACPNSNTCTAVGGWFCCPRAWMLHHGPSVHLTSPSPPPGRSTSLHGMGWPPLSRPCSAEVPPCWLWMKKVRVACGQPGPVWGSGAAWGGGWPALGRFPIPSVLELHVLSQGEDADTLPAPVKAFPGPRGVSDTCLLTVCISWARLPRCQSSPSC